MELISFLLFIQILIFLSSIYCVYRYLHIKKYGSFCDGQYYTIVCENLTNKDVTAIVFGGNKYGVSNKQTEEGVNVFLLESSHAQVKSLSMQYPIKIHGLRYLTTTKQQLYSRILTIARETGDTLQTYPFQPIRYRTSNQIQECQINVDGFQLLINGDTRIEVPLIPNERVTIILRLKPKNKLMKYFSSLINKLKFKKINNI
jgi:hypothetical protein